MTRLPSHMQGPFQPRAHLPATNDEEWVRCRCCLETAPASKPWEVSHKRACKHPVEAGT